ncbi:unnamed protein product, partial [Rotaria sp. Silwood2]
QMKYLKSANQQTPVYYSGQMNYVPPFNQPSFNQPSFNQPSFNQPSFNQPPFNQPPFNHPTSNQPTSNHDQGQMQYLLTVKSSEASFYPALSYLNSFDQREEDECLGGYVSSQR